MSNLKIGETEHDKRSYRINSIFGRYFRNNNNSVINENQQIMVDLHWYWNNIV